MRLKDSVQKENYKILVVDDEQGIIDSLKIFLNHYNITGVTDPLKAIELVRNEHFDLMLLDFFCQIQRISSIADLIYVFLSVIAGNSLLKSSRLTTPNFFIV